MQIIRIPRADALGYVLSPALRAWVGVYGVRPRSARFQTSLLTVIKSAAYDDQHLFADQIIAKTLP